MRFAAFVFSFVLIFSTVQTAYANPLIGLVIRQGLLAKTAKGAVKISKDGKKGLVRYLVGGAVGTAVGNIATYCAKNKKICQEVLGEAWDTVEDMLGGNDDEAEADGYCTTPKMHYRVQGYSGYDRQTAINQAVISGYNSMYKNNSNYKLIGYKSDDFDKISSDFYKAYKKLNKQDYIRYAKTHKDKKQKVQSFLSMVKVDYDFESNYNGRVQKHTTSNSIAVDIDFECYADKDTYITNNNQDIEQVINQTINNKSETEINNIIEKHITEIEINNYCSNGGKCDELSKEFANEVFKKLDKYDIDKIDKDNCEVKNNKIVSCRNARIDKDSDDDNQTQKEKSDEDKTINCDATGFHKKVCDFIDWYQDDDGLDDNTKIDVKDDTPEPTNANIDFKATCPPPYEVNISLYGIDINFTLLDTPEVCGFLHTWIKPIMLVIAPLQAVYILGGRND